MLLILKPVLNLFGGSIFATLALQETVWRCLNQWMKGSALLFSHYPDINDLGNLCLKDIRRANECINSTFLPFIL